MFLLAGEDCREQVAADIVARCLAMRDRPLQLVDRLHLQLEVGTEDLLDRFADPQPAERLEIGQPVEEQDALRQLVGMLHLVDRFVALEFGESGDAPMVEQPVVQPVLVDRGELVAECLVEQFDDPCVALHASPPGWRQHRPGWRLPEAGNQAARAVVWRNFARSVAITSSTSSRHEPHSNSQPSER